MAWHNYKLARQTGSDFVVIWDDDQYARQCLWRQGFTFEHARERYLTDLEWMGLSLDREACSTDFADEHERVWRELDLGPPEPLGPEPFRGWDILSCGSPVTEVRYHPAIVASRVADDAMLGVEAFYRGMDLVGEIQLYDYLARRLYSHAPRQEYLPCVTYARSEWREKYAQRDQEFGGPRVTGYDNIRQLREAGYTPREILDTLREAARRSLAKREAAIILPIGVLYATKKNTLRYRGDDELRKSDVEGAEGSPWEADVKAAWASAP